MMMENKNISIIKRILPILVLLLIVAIDIFTKVSVVKYNEANNNVLMYGDGIKVIGDWLKIRLGYNTGGIFGFTFGLSPDLRYYFFLGAMPIAMIVVLIFYVKTKADKLYPRICFAMILGLAIGNLSDRLFGWILYRGEFKLFFKTGVVDWIDAGIPKGVFGLADGWRWYTFNIADSSGVIAIILLFIYILIKGDSFIKRKKIENI